MAQRVSDQAQQWASFSNMGNTLVDWKRWAESHFRDPHAYHEKYSCLNAPAGQDRFEFRLPRGTLRLDRFYKNLEWTYAMIEMTRGTTDKITPVKFMEKIAESRRYPNLLAFMNERAQHLITAAR